MTLTSRPLDAPTPAVSIILPTYNRRNTLLRAVRSVQAQSYTDWELLVIDDGSTDGSKELLATLDEPRLRVIVQANAGAATARNLGLRESRGRYISFLDSDDEWLPHFLALSCGFLDRHPQEAWVATESYEAKADGRLLRQDLHALASHYVDLARSLGSTALALPPGEQDSYLRVFATRQHLGDWALPLARESGIDEPEVRWYRGDIGEHYRWGYFHALWCLVVRAEALDGLSPFPVERRNCNDLQFLIELALKHTSNLIAVPAVRKNLVVPEDQAAAQLTAGRSYVGFTRNYAAVIETCFLRRLPDDIDVQRVYAFRRLEAGKAALAFGLRAEAREHLRFAHRWLRWPSVSILRAMARLAPTNGIAALAFSVYRRIEDRLPSSH